MLRHSLLLLLLVASPGFAQGSQDPLQASQADVDSLVAAQGTHFNYRKADTTLQVAFDRGGVGWARRYTQAWGNNGLYLAWNDAKPLYTDLRNALVQWRAGVVAGRVTRETAVSHGEVSMQMLAALDTEVGRLLWDIVQADVIRAHWLDAYNAVPISDRERKDALYARAQLPLADIAEARAALREIGQIDLLPLPPEAASGAADAFAFVRAMMESETPAVRRAAARVLAHLLAGTEADPNGEAAAILLALAERDALRHNAVWQALLNGEGAESAEAMNLRDGLFDRAGHLLSPHVVMDEGWTISDVERVTDIAKYAAVLADDLHNPSPFSRPSSAQRFLTRIHGAVALADGVENTDGRALVDGLRDLVTGASPVEGGALLGPFDIPAEVSAAQIGVTRQGVLDAADAISGVKGAISGDANGLNRTRMAARRLEQVLSAPNYVRAMTGALTDRLLDRVPIVRTFVNWFSGRG